MPKATCIEQGCREHPVARDLCRRHYGIAYRRGAIPPRQLILGIHSLSRVDVDARIADCAICGPEVPVQVRIRERPGRGRSREVTCLIKVRGNRVAKEQRRRLRLKYNMTQRDYDRMVAKQQGCCAICRTSQPSLFVDHDHLTGAVRGLLCRNCNLALGYMRDDINLLASAAQYLRTHKPLTA